MNPTLLMILLAFGLLALAMMGMGITMLVRKNGKFPNTHIEGNPNLQKLGITCAKCEQMGSCALSEIRESCE